MIVHNAPWWNVKERPDTVFLMRGKRCDYHDTIICNRPICKHVIKKRIVYVEAEKIALLDMWRIFPDLSLKGGHWSKRGVRARVDWPNPVTLEWICDWVRRVALHWKVALLEDQKLKRSLHRFFVSVLTHPECPYDLLYQVYASPNKHARAWFYNTGLSLPRLLNAPGPLPLLLNEPGLEFHLERERIPAPLDEILGLIGSHLSIAQLAQIHLTRKMDDHHKWEHVKWNLAAHQPNMTAYALQTLSKSASTLTEFYRRAECYSRYYFDRFGWLSANFPKCKHFSFGIPSDYMTHDTRDPTASPRPTCDWLADLIQRPTPENTFAKFYVHTKKTCS